MNITLIVKKKECLYKINQPGKSLDSLLTDVSDYDNISELREHNTHLVNTINDLNSYINDMWSGLVGG